MELYNGIKPVDLDEDLSEDAYKNAEVLELAVINRELSVDDFINMYDGTSLYLVKPYFNRLGLLADLYDDFSENKQINILVASIENLFKKLDDEDYSIALYNDFITRLKCLEYGASNLCNFANNLFNFVELPTEVIIDTNKSNAGEIIGCIIDEEIYYLNSQLIDTLFTTHKYDMETTVDGEDVCKYTKEGIDILKRYVAIYERLGVKE